jgi:hypothetical protein
MTRMRLLAAALAVAFGWAPGALAQDKPKDDLDKLLEKLEKKTDKNAPNGPAAKDGQDKPKDQEKAKPKDAAPADKSAEVPSKDKDLDSLLEKLGGTTDKPDTKNERKPPGAPGDAPKPPGEGGAKDDKLKDDQKQLDQVLEERSGKIKKKKNQQQQDNGSGQLAEAIKQMREVEKRLSKTDTGEETRKEQQEIVKKLDQMIQQMRRSQQQGQQGQQRQMAQAGQKPGNRQGQPGSNGNPNAQGVGPQKPARPSFKDVIGDDKNPWGNLPDALREEMANVSKESPLKIKESLINRYFLSVSKKSTSSKGE